MGREAGTPGYDEAARYVAARFEQLGLEAAGDAGEWFQTVRLRSVTRDLEAASFVVTDARGQGQSLVHMQDYIIGRSMAAPAFEVSGPAVFVGDGVVAPEIGRNAYADVDVRGKIAVMFTDAPEGLDGEASAYLRSRSHRLDAAAEEGAVGVVFLQSAAASRRWPWARLIANPSRPAMTWVRRDGEGAYDGKAIGATATLSKAGAEKLFKGSNYEFEALRRIADAKDVDALSFPIGKSITLRGASTFEEMVSANVAGIVRGGDPVLSREVVVLTAHLDHEGVADAGAPRVAGEDLINNGAMDNALGVATMLEVATRFARETPPRRSVLFLAVTAEEKGLLGSDYFAHHPSVDRAAIVANVNLDMPLALFDFEDVIAFGGERSTLGEVVEQAAASMGVRVIPDPIPEQSIFTRSDHYSFVEQGVPSVYVFIGFGNGGDAVFSAFMRDHYHRPSDDLSLPIDYDAATRFAALNYQIARLIADSETAPGWREGDFFGERFGRDQRR